MRYPSAAALEAALVRDVADGVTPVLVAANGGATNTGVVDPLSELAELSDRHGAPATARRGTSLNLT